MKKNLKILAILLLIAFNFTACGIKKDLFLPEKNIQKLINKF
jgi:predicted small lipoprotein YifL